MIIRMQKLFVGHRLSKLYAFLSCRGGPFQPLQIVVENACAFMQKKPSLAQQGDRVYHLMADMFASGMDT